MNLNIVVLYKGLICSAHHSSEEERLLSRGSAVTEQCMFSEQKTTSGLP